MSLKYLIYASTATGPISEVRSILEDAYHLNAANDITGFLYHEKGAFTQYIEGPEEAVDELFDKIKKDPRHTDIKVVEYGPVEDRNFHNWSMELFEGEGESGVPELITETLKPDGYGDKIDLVKMAAAIRSTRP